MSVLHFLTFSPLVHNVLQHVVVISVYTRETYIKNL